MSGVLANQLHWSTQAAGHPPAPALRLSQGWRVSPYRGQLPYRQAGFARHTPRPKHPFGVTINPRNQQLLIATALVSPANNQSPLRLVLVGGMGSIGDNLYRLHQPAAALAQPLRGERLLAGCAALESSRWLLERSAGAVLLRCANPSLRCHPGDHRGPRPAAGASHPAGGGDAELAAGAAAVARVPRRGSRQRRAAPGDRLGGDPSATGRICAPSRRP